MAHEITETDNLVLTGKRAWHGLGTVVKDAPTPQEALIAANLNWTVEASPLTYEGRTLNSHVVIVRSDTREHLGLVSPWYKPLQNQRLADFAYEIGGMGVTVESAGSLKGGKRVFFCLRGETFDVGNDDLVVPYVLLANGHDGSFAFHVQPTSVRVVCNNTLTMALISTSRPSWRALHKGDFSQHIGMAKAVVAMFRSSAKESMKKYQTLKRTGVDQKTLMAFCMDCYHRDFRRPKEKKAAERFARMASAAVSTMEATFDAESKKFGANAWVMLNAYTKWTQNNPRTDSVRQTSKWMGTTAKRSAASLDLALQLAS